MFEHTLRVRFPHCDPAGIAYFGRFFDFCLEAYEEFLRLNGAPLDAIVRSRQGPPLVHVEADFQRPARHGDLVRVRAALGKLSPRSFRIDYTLLDESGRLLARVAHVHAGFDEATGRGGELSAALREALAKLPPADG